jgi:predicted transcriptional regulator
VEDKLLKLKKDKEAIKVLCDALSNINRLKILEEIITKDPNMSHESISKKVGIKPSAVSYHLNFFKTFGFVSETKEKGLRGRLRKVPHLNYSRIIIELG